MIRTCVVNLSSNLVVNVIERGGSVPANCTEDSAPPPGHAWIVHASAGVGWSHAAGTLVPPAEPPQTPPIDLSNLDNLERTLKAEAMLLREYCNALKAEVRGLAVLLVQKGLITNQEATGLLAYAGSGVGNQKTVADLKTDFAERYNALA